MTLSLCLIPVTGHPAPLPSRIAVLPFESQTRAASGVVASDLFDSFLVRHSSIVVVERTRLNQVLGEQVLQQHGGVVDSETAARLHSILGVDSVVIGSILAVDHDVNGGAGTIMMHARLVDASSGRILWADTVTSRVAESFKRKLSRFFTGAGPDSDAIVTSRLIELAAGHLARSMGSSFDPARPAAAVAALPPAAAPAAALDCAGLEGKIVHLAESVLVEEAIYWARRLRDGSALDNPGAGYTDRELRSRLNTKILFWMDEKDLPKLSGRQLERLADAKEQMRRLRSECAPRNLASRGAEFPLVASGRLP